MAGSSLFEVEKQGKGKFKVCVWGRLNLGWDQKNQQKKTA